MFKVHAQNVCMIFLIEVLLQRHISNILQLTILNSMYISIDFVKKPHLLLYLDNEYEVLFIALVK